MHQKTKTILKSVFVLIFISILALNHFSAFASGPVNFLGLKNRPINGGAGDPQKIAGITCLTKKIDEKADGIFITYEMGTTFGRYFYVENNSPSLYAKDPAFNSELIHPELKFSGPNNGMITKRITFTYYDKHNGARTRDDYFLDLNAEIVMKQTGSIHTLGSGSDDPRKYYPVDFSNINKQLPECKDPDDSSSSNPGTNNPGQSSLPSSCGTWGPTAQELGTCTDGSQNSNETGVDSGGRCSPGMLGPTAPGSQEAFFGHWPSPTRPVKISVEDNLSPVYSQFLPRALRDWNQATPIVVTRNGSDSIQVPIVNCDFGQTDWVGVTVVNLNDGKIVDAPVYINDHWMKTSFYNNAIQQQYVVTHELGHAFGLDHQDTEFCNPNLGSVMDYTYSILGGTKPCGGQGSDVNFGVSNEHPNAKDINALINAYSVTP